jgi:hypothetical protein
LSSISIVKHSIDKPILELIFSQFSRLSIDGFKHKIGVSFSKNEWAYINK